MFRCQAVSRGTRQHPYSSRSRPSTALVARDLEETLSVAVKRRPRHTETGIELPRTDGRTVAARRFRSLVEAFEAELGGQLSEVDKSPKNR